MSMSRTAHGLSRLGEDWRTQAACRSDPERQFPNDSDVGGVAAAKYVCHGCPVTRECLRWALDSGEAHGVWGGLTPEERAFVGVRRWCTKCRTRFQPTKRNQLRCDHCRDGRSKP